MTEGRGTRGGGPVRRRRRGRAGRLGTGLFLLPLVFYLGSCAPGIPPAPARSPAPVLRPPPSAAGLLEMDWGWTRPAAPPAEDPDPILSSRFARHPEISRDVAAWIERFTVAEGRWFVDYLARMGRYGPLVDSTLEARALPPSLRYLPIVESGYSPAAVSRASAAGLWQFMAPVARGFGMRVDAVVDERRDPVLATPAALDFLADLERRFGSWFLALAAYNGGPNRVARLIRRHAPLSPPGDSLYLVIRPHLPRETQQFVPRFLAAAALAERPGRYGLHVDRYHPPLAYDEVSVPDATTLDVVAFAAGVDEDSVRSLNPQLVRGVTPRGRRTRLRIPPGRASRFREVYATIPPRERVTVTEHVVRPGETLSEIARVYGIRTAELEAANPAVEARRLQIGTRLVVPLVPGRR